MKPGTKVLFGVALIIWTVSFAISAYTRDYPSALWALSFLVITIGISRI